MLKSKTVFYLVGVFKNDGSTAGEWKHFEKKMVKRWGCKLIVYLTLNNLTKELVFLVQNVVKYVSFLKDMSV